MNATRNLKKTLPLLLILLLVTANAFNAFGQRTIICPKPTITGDGRDGVPLIEQTNMTYEDGTIVTGGITRSYRGCITNGSTLSYELRQYKDRDSCVQEITIENFEWPTITAHNIFRKPGEQINLDSVVDARSSVSDGEVHFFYRKYIQGKERSLHIVDPIGYFAGNKIRAIYDTRTPSRPGVDFYIYCKVDASTVQVLCSNGAYSVKGRTYCGDLLNLRVGYEQLASGNVALTLYDPRASFGEEHILDTILTPGQMPIFQDSITVEVPVGCLDELAPYDLGNYPEGTCLGGVSQTYSDSILQQDEGFMQIRRLYDEGESQVINVNLNTTPDNLPRMLQEGCGWLIQTPENMHDGACIVRYTHYQMIYPEGADLYWIKYAGEHTFVPEVSGVYTLIATEEDELGNMWTHTFEFVVEEMCVDIFPNPASEQVTVRLNAGSADFLKMFSADGKEVLQLNIRLKEEVSINIEHLPKGIYFIRIRHITKKLVKS